jgi:hypothetical protein
MCISGFELFEKINQNLVPKPLPEYLLLDEKKENKCFRIAKNEDFAFFVVIQNLRIILRTKSQVLALYSFDKIVKGYLCSYEKICNEEYNKKLHRILQDIQNDYNKGKKENGKYKVIDLENFNTEIIENIYYEN